MAHFYGGVSGRRGEATRLGDKSSGMSVFANGWGSGIRASMEHWQGKDNGRVTFNGGSGHGGGSLTVGFNDMDLAIQALATDDKKIRASVERIRKEFDKIEEHAPVAIRRYERRQKIAANQRDKELKARQERLDTIRDSITGEEVDNYLRCVRGFEPREVPEWYDTDRAKDDITSPYGHVEPKRNDDGHLVIVDGDGYNSTQWNLTTGEKA